MTRLVDDGADGSAHASTTVPDDHVGHHARWTTRWTAWTTPWTARPGDDARPSTVDPQPSTATHIRSALRRPDRPQNPQHGYDDQNRYLRGDHKTDAVTDVGSISIRDRASIGRARAGTDRPSVRRHSRRSESSLRGRHRMKFRVERDALADAVAWTAHEPAHPPVGPGARRASCSGRRRHADRLRLRLRGLQPGRRSRCTPTPPARALVSGRLLAEITKALPAQAGRRRRRSARRSRSPAAAPGSPCRPMPVEDYPTLPTMPRPPAPSTRHVRRTPSPRSRSPPAATTRCRCSPASGSRSRATTLTLLATDRYRLAVRELAWQPEQTDAVSRRCWSRPARWPTPRRRSARAARRSPSRWPAAAPARA